MNIVKKYGKTKRRTKRKFRVNKKSRTKRKFRVNKKSRKRKTIKGGMFGDIKPAPNWDPRTSDTGIPASQIPNPYDYFLAEQKDRLAAASKGYTLPPSKVIFPSDNK